MTEKLFTGTLNHNQKKQYQHEDNTKLYSTYTPVYNQRRETYKPPAKYSFVW